MRLTPSKRVGSGLVPILAAATLLAMPAALRAQGTVTGRVTAAGTEEPLGDARVMVVNTSIIVPTGGDGRYTIRNAPTGNIEVRVLRVGYQEQKKAVAVSAGANVTLNFTMQQAVVQLQEIVTTATGDQRRVELGNSVSTLGDVNNKVETTPITNLGDLMVAKAPGVSVLEGAMTGAAPVIRIRGLNSLATTGSGISNAPIYIVDGVHINAGAIGLGTGGTSSSFLNDLDPNEIEDVEIVKGPSAATLYGTNASNGVIVITTKKGRAGSTRWTWYGEGGGVDDRNTYPTDYASWGHVTAAAATTALPAGTTERCTLVSEAAGSCALDSLTSFSVLNNQATTSLHLGHHNGYGMNASGGSDQVRFFVSGDLANELGPTFMPTFARRTLDSLGTPALDQWVNPEQYQQYSMRANLSAAFSPKFDFNVNTGFSNFNQTLPQVDNNTFSYLYSALNNPGFNHTSTAVGLGYNELQTVDNGSGTQVYRNGYGGFSPAQIFQNYNTNGTQRFIGSADATWRPFSWMNNQATTGIDLADNVFTSTCLFAQCPNSGTLRQGSVSDTQTNLRNFTAKITSNMTWQATSTVNFKTTLGTEYGNNETDGVNDGGTNLPPGAQTVNATAVKSANTGNTLQTVTKILGYYAQEQASIRDRLFLVVAARTDENSAFGTQFQRVLYPKASASYIISDESFFPHFDWLNQLRLRGAYGASGNQPGSTVALQTFNASTANVAAAGATGGADTPGLIAAALGNPDLKPERSVESELGFETSVLNNRAHFDFTYYSKKTHDALVSLPIAASSGASTLSVVENLASVSNSGLEFSMNTTLIDRRALGWDMTIAASHNSNKINSIGNDATGKPLPTIGTGSTRDSLGASVNGFFARPYTYADANGDGIISPNEVTVSPNFVYVGYSQPRDIFAVTNGIDLFNRKLRITVLTDYKGGYLLYNQSGQFYSSNFPTWYSENLKSTPLWDQARTVANSSAKNPNPSIEGYLENGQFWKLREVSAALTLPTAFANKIRARDAQLVFSARNLHTWTSYTGTDPESNYSTGDTQTDFSTIAPRTYFLVRANLHY
jgi:TonB-linked SusC/RagA family outer membrane protein